MLHVLLIHVTPRLETLCITYTCSSQTVKVPCIIYTCSSQTVEVPCVTGPFTITLMQFYHVKHITIGGKGPLFSKIGTIIIII